MWKPHGSGCISTKRLVCLGVIGAPTAVVNISVLDAHRRTRFFVGLKFGDVILPGRDAGHLNLPVDVRFFANDCREGFAGLGGLPDLV
jgi:hypothetical protein